MKRKTIVIIISIIIIGIGILLGINIIFPKVSNNKKISLSNSAIGSNMEMYEGMKVYEKNGDVIVESDEGGKTIETLKTKEETGRYKLESDEKEQFYFSNIKVLEDGGRTKIVGKVKNNSNRNKEVIIITKFYSEDNKIKGSANATLTLNTNETKDFEMYTMENLTSCKYKIEVAYAK